MLSPSICQRRRYRRKCLNAYASWVIELLGLADASQPAQSKRGCIALVLLHVLPVGVPIVARVAYWVGGVAVGCNFAGEWRDVVVTDARYHLMMVISRCHPEASTG